MSNHNNIDDFFKKKLGNTGGGEIPGDFLADINTRLDALEKKKKRVGIWWWIVPGIALGAFLTWGTMTLLGSNAPKHTAMANHRTNTQNKANQGQKSIYNVPTTNDPTTQTGTPSGSAANSKPQTAPLANNNGPVNNSNTILTTKNATHALNTYAVNPNKGVVKNNSKNKKVEGGNRYGNDKQTTNRREKNDTRNDQNVPVLVNAGLANDSAGTHPGNVKSFTSENGNDLSESINLTTTPDSSNQLPVSLTTPGNPSDSLPKVSPVDGPAAKNPSTKNKLKWNIAVLGGAQYVKNRFPGAAGDDVLAKRKQEEKSIITLNASVMAGVKVKKWEFSAGFSYTTWGEKTAYSPAVYKFTSYTTVIDTSTGDTATVATQQNQENVFEKRVNKYHYLNLQLMAGYTITKGKWDFVPKLGLGIGHVIGKNDGVYLVADYYEPAHESAPYWLINANLAVDVAYRINKMRFFISPFYSRNVWMTPSKPISPENNFFAIPSYFAGTAQNHYHAFGLNFGLSIDLGK